ncbi:hypothetical protein ABK040_008803 [Willaertia magna]
MSSLVNRKWLLQAVLSSEIQDSLAGTENNRNLVQVISLSANCSSIRPSQTDKYFLHLSDSFNFIHAEVDASFIKKLYRKHPEVRPLSKIRGSIIRLDKYTIEKESNKYFLKVNQFEVIGANSSSTFKEPKELNGYLTKHFEKMSKETVTDESFYSQNSTQCLISVSQIGILQNIDHFTNNNEKPIETENIDTSLSNIVVTTKSPVPSIICSQEMNSENGDVINSDNDIFSKINIMPSVSSQNIFSLEVSGIENKEEKKQEEEKEQKKEKENVEKKEETQNQSPPVITPSKHKVYSQPLFDLNKADSSDESPISSLPTFTETIPELSQTLNNEEMLRLLETDPVEDRSQYIRRKRKPQFKNTTPDKKKLKEIDLNSNTNIKNTNNVVEKEDSKTKVIIETIITETNVLNIQNDNVTTVNTNVSNTNDKNTKKRKKSKKRTEVIDYGAWLDYI